MSGATALIRVGLAGLGTMGRNHLRNLVGRDDTVLVAAADPSDEARNGAGPMMPAGASLFEEPLAMLQEMKLDAVIVAAPTTAHHAIVLEAIARHVAVLVEKPIAASVEEGRELVRAAADEGVLLQVGHIERFNPAILALGERLRSGGLSRTFSIKTTRGGPLPYRIRDVGVAVDLATHDLDIMCHLAGERPDHVYAEATNHVHTSHEDLLYALLVFPNGVIGQLDVNWLTPEKQRRVVVLGTEGMFEVDYLRQSLRFTRGAEQLEPTYLEGYAPMFVGDAINLPVRPAEPLRAELDAFFGALRSGAAPTVSGQDGLAALALARLLLTSAAERRPIAIDPLVYS